jgi:hypothetical protein
MRMGATIRLPAPQPTRMKVLRQTTVVILLVFACVFIIGAQSGRRQTKPATPAPIPSPTPDPTPAPKAEQKEPDFIFYVGADRHRSYGFYPYSFYDAVLSGCSEVLRRGSSAKVDVTDRDLPRGEAIKKSKENAKTYTVLLQLTEPTMSGNPSNQNYDQIELEYVVFAPLTGKVATSGHTFQYANRKGPIVVGPTGGGPTSALYREALLKQAGQDAGERILRALHLSVPKTN